MEWGTGCCRGSEKPVKSVSAGCLTFHVFLPLSMVSSCWWDPIMPIRIMNHVQHFCDNLVQFALKDNKGQQKATLCDHLWCLIPLYNTLQCSLSLVQPFLTFSGAFRPFETFLDFALFNTPPDCITFSGACHQTLFTWLVHHSFSIRVLFQANQPCTLPMFCVSFYYYSCTYVSCYQHYQIEQRVPPSTVLQCIDLRSHCAFFGTHCTVSTDLSLTWTTFSDHFRVPYHHTYTLILPPFHCKRQVTLSSVMILGKYISKLW